jgi:quercetin dioxygenase-like cupin family protein
MPAEQSAPRPVEDPVLRNRYVFRRSVDDDGTEVVEVETWVDPGGGAAPHIHPSMEERFEILEGRPEFLSGRKWQQTAPGDTVVVPAGVRHGFRNRTKEPAHFKAFARPGLELQEFLEDVATLSREGKLMRGGIPKGFDGLLAGAVLAKHYRETVIILMPPPSLQRLLLGPLARLGERRGYRAGSFAKGAAA